MKINHIARSFERFFLLSKIFEIESDLHITSSPITVPDDALSVPFFVQDYFPEHYEFRNGMQQQVCCTNYFFLSENTDHPVLF